MSSMQKKCLRIADLGYYKYKKLYRHTLQTKYYVVLIL